jgi:DNA-binding response OmpR family regulator
LAGREGVASVGAVVRGTVLLVEHEGPVRAYLEQQLADDGFEVLAADRGVQALDLAEEVKPDLVLLDAVLPAASGFELSGRLRDGEPGRRWNRDVPVIMVSARGDPVDRVRGFARGCDDYVVKPFVYDELLARMRAVLRRSNGPRHTRLTVRDLRDRPRLPSRHSGRRDGATLRQGVRAPRRARRGSRAGLQVRRAPAQRLGLPVAR